MQQLIEILLFPFYPGSALIYFGSYILPWIYLIGVIVVAVMLYRSKERLFSMMFFIVPSVITSLIVALERVNYYFGFLDEIIHILLNFLFVIGPLFLLFSLILSLSGIIETIFRKLSMGSLIIAVLALFCSFCFYLFLVLYAAVLFT